MTLVHKSQLRRPTAQQPSMPGRRLQDGDCPGQRQRDATIWPGSA